MYTGGTEKNVEVKLLEPETVIPEAEVEVLPQVEAAPPSVSIEEIEEELVEEQKKEQARRSNMTLIIIIALVVLIVIVGFVFYHKGKKESEAPFLE